MDLKKPRNSSVVIEIESLIGQGSNGCVYRGWRSDQAGTIRQSVAIKILNSRNLVEVWRDEFLSLMQVTSPRCVRVFGFEWIDERPALILELVEGVDLAELSSTCELSRDEVRYLASEVAAALEDLRLVGLCHGDLSPANILIDKSGTVRLVDFGFGNSSAGRRRVTPAYAAPEILNGSLPNYQSDLWSLGVIINQLLNQRRWTGGGTESLTKVNAQERRAPQACDPELASRAGAKLAMRVESLVHRRQACARQTRVFESFDGNTESSVNRRRAIAMAALLVLFSAASRGSASRAEVMARTESVKIKIRSNLSVSVSWDGRWIGYAPLDIMADAGSKHQLSWKGPGGDGQRTLTVLPGRNMVIDDQMFSNHHQ